MMRIVRDSGYHGFVGIESGASDYADEMQAIQLTKNLLEQIRDEQMRVKPILMDSLEGWKNIHGGEWTVENGVLVGKNGKDWSTDPEKAGSWLYYNEMVKDFRLEFQYMLAKGGNSGVFFRSALEKNPAYTGYEMQITASTDPQPNDRGTPGAIYQLAKPTKNNARPVGAWNTVTIMAQGSNITIEMNGEKVIAANLDRSFAGFIGFQNHDEQSIIKLKNIRLEKI